MISSSEKLLLLEGGALKQIHGLRLLNIYYKSPIIRKVERSVAKLNRVSTNPEDSISREIDSLEALGMSLEIFSRILGGFLDFRKLWTMGAVFTNYVTKKNRMKLLHQHVKHFKKRVIPSQLIRTRGLEWVCTSFCGCN